MIFSPRSLAVRVAFVFSLAMLRPGVASAADDLPRDSKALIALADSGNAAAQFELAKGYSWGAYGITVDKTRAFDLLVAAARQKYPKAGLELSYMLANGTWTDAQRIEAMKWLEQEAQAGVLQAQEVASRTYSEGPAVLRNEAKSFHWLLEAAKQGEPFSAYNVGLRYAAGRGVEKNEPEAIAWFRKISDPGTKPFAEWQARRIEAGLPAEKGPAALQAGMTARAAGRDKEAFDHFMTAANTNLPPAMIQVGWCYLQGRGVAKDIKGAEFWLELAKGLNPDASVTKLMWDGLQTIEQELKRAPVGIGFDGKPRQYSPPPVAPAVAASAPPQLPVRVIGQRVGDGIVFWVDHTGQHGLIVELNEMKRVEVPSDQRPTQLNATTGLSDWYVPSLDEWKQLHAARRQVEQFLVRENGTPFGKNGFYWTATTVLYQTAKIGVFHRYGYEVLNGGDLALDTKRDYAALRKVRQF